ncbi:MAG: bifunctional metallophosphatase/5'-nucleotidase, partial [Clostridia bacterium]|nr:bifunctional metallophosphatase/5'-nucleotidase [Clostridia bacterium]
MKNKIIAMIVCVLLLVSIVPFSAFAQSNDDIVILYENDVHCEISGYTKIAAMKNELLQTYQYVGVVSGGDYVQGQSLGVVSRGEYIVKIMNLVGYDAVTLGNHEFDYKLDRLNELVGMMNTKPVSCKFQKIGEDSSYFEPYTIVSYGDIDIAYIGITTPSTVTSSSPAQFKDENGNFIYTFNPSTLYEVVQKNIDSAKAAGAEYVIALSHIGYAEDELYGDMEDIEDLIENTNGLDVVLDAPSHSVIEGMKLVDKGGNEVLLSSTGTKFEYIGKLTISNGEFQTELIKTADYQLTDPVVDAYIQQISEEYSALGDRKVAITEVDLITKDAEGNRLVRNTETSLGDLCAEAMRSALNAEIGYMNGGGIRSDILAGDVTFNHLLNVMPFNNSVVLAEVSGQTLLDMMEMAVMSWPAEDGSFPHLAGVRFSVNTSIPTSVVVNEQEEFVSVSGEYRVYNMEIFDKETEQYVPIDLTDTYTLAASNYFLLDYGSGMTMLKNAKIIQNEGMLDVEALEYYVVDVLGGT